MMYYNRKKLIISLMWTVIGFALLALSMTGTVDDPLCSGMGGGLLAIGIMQIIKNVRYATDDAYKEKIDIAYKDERNRYIRMKAWSFAGYLFIIAAAIISIALFLSKQTVYGQIVSYCMCGVLALYWISYMILQKRN